MMLARVADSLYWIGRYIERAEHVSRLSAVMLNATLDSTLGAVQIGHMGLAALGEKDSGRASQTYEAAHDLALDREDTGSVVTSLARARENARQVRDQITTETWERLNLLYLRVTGAGAEAAFDDDPAGFLQEIIADVKEGLLVTEFLGFGVNLVTGDFSRGASGLWIQNGELTFPVEEITVAGNLKDMLFNISEIGTDLEFRGAIASPTLRMDGMTVAGE